MNLNRTTRHFGCLQIALASVLISLTTASAQALDYQWDISGEVEHQSNATLSEDEYSGVLTVAGSEFSFDHTAQHLNLNGHYEVEYGAFQNDTNDDRFDADGNSFSLWQITDKVFAWQLFHVISSTVANRGETSSDPTLANTADNRRTRNQIATGPIVTLPFTSVDSVQLTGSYQEVMFSDADNDALNETDPDSESRSGSASWLHQLSPTSTLSLSYNYSEVDHDNNDSVEATTIFETAYFSYSRQLSRNSYLVRLGNNRSKAKDRDENDGFYYLGEYQHDFGNQQLSFSASQQKTSTAFGSYGSGFNAGGGESIGLSQGNYEVDDITETTTLQVDYSSTMYCSRCQYGVVYSHADNNYDELGGEDDSTDLLTLRYSHRFNPNLNGSISLRHLQRSFDTDNNDNSDSEVNIVFERQQNQRLSFEFGAGFMTRNSDREADAEYDNTTVFIAVNYNLINSSGN